MRGSSFVLGACVATASCAIQLSKPPDAAQIPRLDIQRRADVAAPVLSQRLRKRSGSVQATLDNAETLYYADLTLGTPPQRFRLHVDTGSSDLWVNTASSQLCSQGASACGMSGTYSANASSTYKYVDSFFNITYEDASGASGDYATDTLVFSNLTMENFEFGIGYRSTSAQGILGLGYPDNEVAITRGRQYQYNNLPAAMANTGVIASNAFSLYLNDLDASTGSILFGGVDTAKFQGTLSSVPAIAEGGRNAEFIIALTGVGQNGNSSSILQNARLPVLLDSGSSLTYLPAEVANNMFAAFGGRWNDRLQAAVVDCSLANQTGSIDFEFSGVPISVSLSELTVLQSEFGAQKTCIFGISRGGSGTSVLGDTFLRSAYVVYDIANNEISLAQTNFNARDSNIELIGSGTDSVPSATPVQNAVTSVTGLVTGAARIAGVNAQGAAALVTPPPTLKYGAVAIAGAGLAWAL